MRIRVLTIEVSGRWFRAADQFLPAFSARHSLQHQLLRCNPAVQHNALQRAEQADLVLYEIEFPVDTGLLRSLTTTARRGRHLLVGCTEPRLVVTPSQSRRLHLDCQQLGFSFVLSETTELPLAFELTRRFIIRHRPTAPDLKSRIVQLTATLPWPEHASVER